MTINVAQYTKGQKARILKIGALYGKQFSEASLVNELDKIFSSKWQPYRISDGIVIRVPDDTGLSFTLRFDYVKGQKMTYTLLEFSCGKNENKMVM